MKDIGRQQIQRNNRLHIPKPPHISCTNRQWERALNRLRSGHSRLTHSHLMSGNPTPICEQCQTDEVSIKHLLMECPTHRTKRLRFFGSSDVSLKRILKEGNTDLGSSLYQYIREINILEKL